MNSILETPILIAGPTASGKSALALEVSELAPSVIINADALQVYACWERLTACPSPEDMARAPHLLYRYVEYNAPYSVGHWLRDVKAALEHAKASGKRPIIIGGTGLYFSALTQGLADIPPISAQTRHEANRLPVEELLSELRNKDPKTAQRIDQLNPVRIRRAWEVLRETGRGLADWQDETPDALLGLSDTIPIVLRPSPEWLNERINTRFEAMLQTGALDECRAMLDHGWDPTLPSSKALGASQLIAYLQDEITLEDAIESAKTATRQYAKRQRTWFRNRFSNWHSYEIHKVQSLQSKGLSSDLMTLLKGEK